MGRKKKKQTDSTIKESETQAIGYQGSISVSVKRGDKTILKRSYHNSGMPNLFRYIANVVAGNSANELRPVKIKLFNYADTTQDALTPANFKWDSASPYLEAVTPYVLFDTTPVVRSGGNSGEEASYGTTLHFRIPSSYISNPVIHVVALYPNNAAGKNDLSAYYTFADEKNKNSWKPIDMSDSVGDFSIIIEWTLETSNITKAN